MILRALYSLALIVLLAVSIWLGASRIIGFSHRYAGEEALSRAELDFAFEELTEATTWQPGDAYNYVLVGRVIQLAQDNGVTLTMLEGLDPAQASAHGISAIIKGIGMNPSDALGWFNMAQAYRSSRIARTRMDRLRAMVEAVRTGKSPSEARAAAEGTGLRAEDLMVIAGTLKARGLEPEFSFYWDFLARLYWDRGLPGEAAGEIREGFRLTPQIYAHPWIADAAMTADLQGPILEGIRASAASSFIDPLAPLLARAEVLERLDRKEDAITAYQELRMTGGGEVQDECDLRIARLQQALGRYEESMGLLERVVAADPLGRRAGSAYFHLGVAEAQRGDHPKAVAHFRRHLSLKAGSPVALLALAHSLEKIGRDKDAEQIYAGLVDRMEDDPRPYERVIRLLLRRRQKAEAFHYADRYSKVSTDAGTPAEILKRLGPAEPE